MSPDYTSLVQGQRTYFKAGKTRPVSWRIEQLKAIKAMIEARRGDTTFAATRPTPI